MTHCVPDWDGNCGELEVIIESSDYLPPVKGKDWSAPRKRSPSSGFSPLQSSDVPSLRMESGTEPATEPNRSEARSPDWEQGNPTNWSNREGAEDAVPPAKPPGPELVRDGILAVNVPLLDPTLDSLADDEMLEWLHYPLDESLEKSYGSEFFPANSNEDSLVRQQAGQWSQALNRSNIRQLPSVTAGPDGSFNRGAIAEVAMAIGAGRAAGVVLPQTGVEAFTQVRTVQPNPGKGSPGTLTLGTSSTSCSQGVRTPSEDMPNVSSSVVPPLQTQPVPFLSGRKETVNFPCFVPAVAMKAAQHRMRNPHLSNTPTGGPRPFDVRTSSRWPIVEPTSRQQNEASTSGNLPNAHVQGAEGQLPSLATDSSWPSSVQNSQLSSLVAQVAVIPTGSQMGSESNPVDLESCPHDSQLASQDTQVAVIPTGNHMGTESSPVDLENCHDGVDASNDATPSVDEAVTQTSELPELPEQTLTSSSGGSGNRGKRVQSKGRRRSREEEVDYQSEDVEDDVTELRKPPPRSGTTKRARAAEVHNLSERRRRDRINEKMKALQELIPNSNKADKASMLDEAIEYVKKLQLQMQMMSMRTGMGVPSMVYNGMQHLQVPQMGGMPPMGIGIGMGQMPMVGMGGMVPMGMGIPDMNQVAAGRTSHLMPHMAHAGSPHMASPMMPQQSHRGASYNVSQAINHPSQRGSSLSVSATPPAVSMVDYMIHQQQQQQQYHQQYQQQQQQQQQQQLPFSYRSTG